MSGPTKKAGFSYKGVYFCHRELGAPVGEWRLLGVYDTKRLMDEEQKPEHYVLLRIVNKGAFAQTHVLTGVDRNAAERELKKVAAFEYMRVPQAA